MLYKITQTALQQDAVFDPETSAFQLHNNPFKNTEKGKSIPLGKYRLGSPDNRPIEDAHIYRPGHSLAQCLIESYCKLNLPAVSINFNYSEHPQNAVAIAELVGKKGWLSLRKLTIDSAKSEDHLLFSAISDDGSPVSQQQVERLFTLPAKQTETGFVINDDIENVMNRGYEKAKAEVLDVISQRNTAFFEDEITKLDTWADDQKRIDRAIY